MKVDNNVVLNVDDFKQKVAIYRHHQLTLARHDDLLLNR